MSAQITVYRKGKIGPNLLGWITYEPATRKAVRYTIHGDIIDVQYWNTSFHVWMYEYAHAWTEDINQSIMRDFIDVGL